MKKGKVIAIGKQGLRINGAIRARFVRLIDESNKQVGIVDREQAISRAQDVGLDLVEVSPGTDPPVCRIMDYGKWLYEQKRKNREGRKKTRHHSDIVKEIRINPEIDKHDLDIKVNHARQFLEKGYRVQFTLLFRGRQLLHQEMGVEMFNFIIDVLAPVSKVDSPQKMTFKRLVMVLMPAKSS